MSDTDWCECFAKSFTMFLNGDGLAPDERGCCVTGASFLLLFNAHVDPVTFTLVGTPCGRQWRPVLDTACDCACRAGALQADTQLERPGLSLIVLQREG